MTNAGIFKAGLSLFSRDLTPLGLYVEDGKELIPLNLSDGAGNFFMKPNGVFLVTATGAQIVDSVAYQTVRGVRFATQSGPLLVRNGVFHPQFQPDSKNRAIRSGVGVCSSKRIVFAISNDQVNFYSFASLFRDKLGCNDALYLDGYISKMYIRGEREETDGDFAGLIVVYDNASGSSH